MLELGMLVLSILIYLECPESGNHTDKIHNAALACSDRADSGIDGAPESLPQDKRVGGQVRDNGTESRQDI